MYVVCTGTCRIHATYSLSVAHKQEYLSYIIDIRLRKCSLQYLWLHIPLLLYVNSINSRLLVAYTTQCQWFTLSGQHQKGKKCAILCKNLPVVDLQWNSNLLGVSERVGPQCRSLKKSFILHKQTVTKHQNIRWSSLPTLSTDRGGHGDGSACICFVARKIGVHNLQSIELRAC